MPAQPVERNGPGRTEEREEPNRVSPRWTRRLGALGVAVGLASSLTAPAAAMPAVDGPAARGPASTAARAGSAWPTLAPGDVGTDVRALQFLLAAAGHPATGESGYGAATVAAVRALEAERGLARDGLAGPVVWLALVPRLEAGALGDAVRALQLELAEKRQVALAVDGVFGTATRTALVAFQRDLGLGPTGAADPGTWRALVRHLEYLAVGRPIFCDYDTGNGLANWGTGSTVGWLERFAADAKQRGFGRTGVGDVSLERGGGISGHDSHRLGLDADILAIRRDRQACAGTRWFSASYDRAATRAYLQLLRASLPDHVKVIYFNDPVLIREGLTVYRAGHDDHIHIRFCESAGPDPRYVCPAVLPPADASGPFPWPGGAWWL